MQSQQYFDKNREWQETGQVDLISPNTSPGETDKRRKNVKIDVHKCLESTGVGEVLDNIDPEKVCSVKITINIEYKDWNVKSLLWKVCVQRVHLYWQITCSLVWINSVISWNQCKTLCVKLSLQVTSQKDNRKKNLSKATALDRDRSLSHEKAKP